MTAPPIPRTPSFRLDNRRALVTGAGRGIGSAVAAALAEAGAHVTLCARTASEIEQGATALRDAGLLADWIAIDVTDTVAFAEAIAAAEPYSIFVNNAAPIDRTRSPKFRPKTSIT
jgi:NAD(P)-dependent dehydrogenase (short-subunit alcohol dehydrogenase family)